MSSPITDPVYSSSMSAGGRERTLHLVTDGTLAGGTESSASYAETASSPGPAQPVSVEQSGTANTSTSSGGFAGFATETLFTRSSKIPTHSSFQNDLTSKLVSLGVRLVEREVHIVLHLSMLYTKFSFTSTCNATCGFTQWDVFIEGLKARPHLAGESFQE